ncbi:MAG: DUF1269 domain-containing protein [Peptococcaceae bacterium]|nr:DUF1269 domain-containing protein [Peptococcaceae bacterium]
MENIVVAMFPVESEAYQAFSALKRDYANSTYTISQMVLVKRENNQITAGESFDSGVKTSNDTILGGLLGSMVGILGGPIGVLLGGSMGVLLGSTVDSCDAIHDASLLEYVSTSLVEGEVALIAVVQEADETLLNTLLAPYQATIVRYDAAEIADEIENAANIQWEMRKTLKKQLKEEKSAQRKEKIAQKKDKIKKEFDELKEDWEDKKEDWKENMEDIKDKLD